MLGVLTGAQKSTSEEKRRQHDTNDIKTCGATIPSLSLKPTKPSNRTTSKCSSEHPTAAVTSKSCVIVKQSTSNKIKQKVNVHFHFKSSRNLIEFKSELQSRININKNQVSGVLQHTQTHTLTNATSRFRLVTIVHA